MTFLTHPSMDRLRRYCEGEMPDFEESALEDHLADCEECLSAVRRMEALLFTGLTAEAHADALAAEALEADALADALRRALRAYGQYSQGIRAWLAGAGALWGDASVRLLGEAGLAPARGSAGTPLLRILLAPGELRAEVSVREAVQTVEVSVAGTEPGLAVLFQPGEGGFVMVARIEAAGDAGLARFADVPEGRYLLAVSPHA